MTEKVKEIKTTKVLAYSDVLAEFEKATSHIDFTDHEEMKELFYYYFVAGALFAQAQLVPTDVWVPRTVEELTKAKEELLKPR